MNTVYGVRVKDTGPNPRWDGEWHRVVTRSNPSGTWGKKANAEAVLKRVLEADADLIGHVFVLDVIPQLGDLKINDWVHGNVYPLSKVPAEHRGNYRDTLNRTALAAYRSSKPVYASSTYRTRERQEELYQEYLSGGALAAKPGTSAHERGLAIDIPGARQNRALIKQLRKLGLIDDVPSEDWHLTNRNRV